MNIQERIDKAGTLLSLCGKCGIVYSIDELRWHLYAESWLCEGCFEKLGKMNVVEFGKIVKSDWSGSMTLAQTFSLNDAERWAQRQREDWTAQANDRDRRDRLNALNALRRSVRS